MPTASQGGQYLKNLMDSCSRKLFVLFLFFSSMSSSADINILVQGVEHDRGFIDIRIYLDAETWLKENQTAEHIVVHATKGKVVVPLTTFQGGTLAAVVYHDENSDGKLNTGLFWQPKEGFAFSNWRWQPNEVVGGTANEGSLIRSRGRAKIVFFQL